MLKKLFLGLASLVAIEASATPKINPKMFDVRKLVSRTANFKVSNVNAEEQSALPFKVGEFVKYNLDFAGLASGEMSINIREETTEGVWLEQKLSFGPQDSKTEILYDKNSGEVKRVIVDGAEQTLTPGEDGGDDGSSSEIVDSRVENVTVKAGTFEASYIKVLTTEANGEKSELEIWINPELIPIVGLVKQVAASPYGPVTIELVQFKKL